MISLNPEQLTAESPAQKLHLVLTYAYEANPRSYVDEGETTTIEQMGEVDATCFTEDPGALWESLDDHWDQVTVAVVPQASVQPPSPLVMLVDQELSADELEQFTTTLDQAMAGAHRIQFADDQVVVEANPSSPAMSLVRWLASLENSPERATVTLTQIIDRARKLLLQQDTFAALSAATEAASTLQRQMGLKNQMEDGSEAEKR